MVDKKTEQEVTEYVDSLALKTVEFWASALEVFFNDFLDAVHNNDRKDLVVSCARVAQLSRNMSDFFKGGAKESCDTADDYQLAVKAAEGVLIMSQKQMDKLYGFVRDQKVTDVGPTVTEEVEAATRSPNRGSN